MVPNEAVAPLRKKGHVIRAATVNADSPRDPRPSVVVLSSSLLADRMLVYSNPPLVANQSISLRMWSTADHDRTNDADIIESFPAVRAFPEFHNYLRRLNDYAWDARLDSPSRQSMWVHVRRGRVGLAHRSLQLAARCIAACGLEESYERWLQRILARYDRSPEAMQRLRKIAPDVVLTTGPHRYLEPAVTAAATRLGIPTLALITSWDNITTKNRMPFRHDGYLVWSERMKTELLEYYPHARNASIYVVGAPQFDAFFQEQFHESRAAFCSRLGLDPQRRFVLYALGSPNFLREYNAVRFLAERVERGEFGDAQLLVRPHPLFGGGEAERVLAAFGSSIRVQRVQADTATIRRSHALHEIGDWVNTFRHADVLVNLSSTATVDAALCDRPVVNLDFDPEPGQTRQALIKDVNHKWSHFKPVAESGGVWLVDSFDELAKAVRTYLTRPDLHRDGRRWIAEYVCGFTDGRSGTRVAEAVCHFASRHARTSKARANGNHVRGVRR